MVHCNINRLFALLLTLLVSTQIGGLAGTASRVRRMIHGTKFNKKSPIVLVRVKQRLPGAGVVESTCSGSLITTQHVLREVYKRIMPGLFSAAGHIFFVIYP